MKIHTKAHDIEPLSVIFETAEEIDILRRIMYNTVGIPREYFSKEDRNAVIELMLPLYQEATRLLRASGRTEFHHGPKNRLYRSGNDES